MFQERFKSENVESDAYFITVLRYIHQNPLTAGVVKNVLDSQWTSFPEYLHSVKITDIDRELNLFYPDRRTAIVMFVNYMQEHNDDQWLDIIERNTLMIRLENIFVQWALLVTVCWQQMDRKNRDAVLAKLKRLNGVSFRQISRIAGILKSVINRVKIGE